MFKAFVKTGKVSPPQEKRWHSSQREDYARMGIDTPLIPSPNSPWRARDLSIEGVLGQLFRVDWCLQISTIFFSRGQECCLSLQNHPIVHSSLLTAVHYHHLYSISDRERPSKLWSSSFHQLKGVSLHLRCHFDLPTKASIDYKSYKLSFAPLCHFIVVFYFVQNYSLCCCSFWSSVFEGQRVEQGVQTLQLIPSLCGDATTHARSGSWDPVIEGGARDLLAFKGSIFQLQNEYLLGGTQKHSPLQTPHLLCMWPACLDQLPFNQNSFLLTQYRWISGAFATAWVDWMDFPPAPRGSSRCRCL